MTSGVVPPVRLAARADCDWQTHGRNAGTLLTASASIAEFRGVRQRSMAQGQDCNGLGANDRPVMNAPLQYDCERGERVENEDWLY